MNASWTVQPSFYPRIFSESLLSNHAASYIIPLSSTYPLISNNLQASNHVTDRFPLYAPIGFSLIYNVYIFLFILIMFILSPKIVESSVDFTNDLRIQHT